MLVRVCSCRRNQGLVPAQPFIMCKLVANIVQNVKYLVSMIWCYVPYHRYHIILHFFKYWQWIYKWLCGNRPPDYPLQEQTLVNAKPNINCYYFVACQGFVKQFMIYLHFLWDFLRCFPTVEVFCLFLSFFYSCCSNSEFCQEAIKLILFLQSNFCWLFDYVSFLLIYLNVFFSYMWCILISFILFNPWVTLIIFYMFYLHYIHSLMSILALLWLPHSMGNYTVYVLILKFLRFKWKYNFRTGYHE